ncbi:chitinase, partial [Aspergillus sclerotialis]
LTHINYAFGLFHPYDDGETTEWYMHFEQDDTNDVGSLISEFITLKEVNPGLNCYLAIGGWAFNSGETATYWSDMASTAAGRKSFAKSVLRTMQEYGFDGVDLDWEYPVSSVRGGSEGDKANLVHLIIDLRETLDAS